MKRQAIIERTIKSINQLPDEKVQEISDFADFVVKRYEGILLTNAIQKLSEQSKTFDFLNVEEDLYTEADLKKVYHG